MKYAPCAFIILTLLFSCKQTLTVESRVLSREEQVLKNLDSLKKMAFDGDLLVRLGDDLLSYQIKYINEVDQSYSHAGMIVEQGTEKLVAHIAPDEINGDVISYIPIDSFLNPAKNLRCALYRYDLSATEREAAVTAIEKFKQRNLHFDRLYDLSTVNEMYCSEMISNAIASATAERIKFKAVNIPLKMQPALYNYFKKELSKNTIAERKIITIDNLYRIPESTLVMQFQLKYLPGE